MSSIGPTAHYTGYVWARNGLSHPALLTREGRLLFDLLRPVIAASRLLRGPTLEPYLLARHRAIDAMLERAIEQDGVTQVLEVACGLSPRGWRFTRRYGDRITYVEADLSEMAARKRDALAEMGSLSDRHRVEEVDALRDTGPRSLSEVTATLDRSEGLAIITEGLLSYLETEAVLGLWARFARELGGFPTGRYLSDIALGGGDAAPHVRVFMVWLSAFVRGRVRVHFRDPQAVDAALLDAGFASARVRPASEMSRGEDANDLAVRAANVLQADSRTGSESSP